MADEAREYVRAAQEAELRGDGFTAAQLLVKAASIYRTTGRPHRALTMLKHARRLDGSRVDLDEQIRRLEWLPESPLESSEVGALSLEAEMQRILAPLEASAPTEDAPPLPGDPSRPIVERGPTKADPSLRAWCSFCCNPGAQVGELVAGPAGAFVCSGCADASLRLLKAGAPVPSPTRVRAGSGFVELPAQVAALEALEEALTWCHRILLVGAEGGGKSAILAELAARCGGRLLHADRLEAAALPEDGPVLIDGLERLDEMGRARVGLLVRDHPGVVVLACRGQAPAGAFVAISGEGSVIVPTTRALVEAVVGTVPAEVLASVQRTVVLEPLDEAGRIALGAARLEARGFPEAVAGRLATQLAREADDAHALCALVDRIPPGTERLERVQPSPKRRSRPKTKRGAGA